MDIIKTIAEILRIRVEQSRATLELLDADNTVPFIARYRKEVTGGLDEEQIRLVQEHALRLRSLDDRRTAIARSLEELGKLTPELSAQLTAASTLTALEDLYQPYKPKRRTRASIARENGLQPLADLILAQPRQADLDQAAAALLGDNVTSLEAAWQGACDIVAETISDHPDVRRLTREKALKVGVAHTEKLPEAVDEKNVYELYYTTDLQVDRVKPHQVLAMNRGEAEKVLRVKVALPEREWQSAVAGVFRPDPRSPLAGKLQEAISDAAERLLLPAIERDVRRELTEKAEQHAIRVFGDNLRALLSQPPLANQTVLGIDPGFRTGCKVAVVDPTGRLLDTDTIYPHEPQKKWNAALGALASLVTRHKVTLITIGNGTASRETEQLAAELIHRLEDAGTHQAGTVVKYLIVNEAGASVYSASPLARSEMPDLDVSIRGAVSIARRAQDPLAELVKIDPKAIGVGMYQHDVNQKQLAASLDGVVESVVNQVGVELNSASSALLTHVAGIGPKLAEKIVQYRDQEGPFADRKGLLKVPTLGPKAFEQAAGFLRVRDGKNPLDASAIHPESYPVAEAVLKMAGLSVKSSSGERMEALDKLLARRPLSVLAAELNVGVPTLKDILVQLVRPGRDPRQDLPAPILRKDVVSMEDLAEGMRLKGTVRNVVDFGAFIDIGVKQDGLLHRSQIPFGTVLKVGEILDVEIQKVEVQRGRISLGWVDSHKGRK